MSASRFTRAILSRLQAILVLAIMAAVLLASMAPVVGSTGYYLSETGGQSESKKSTSADGFELDWLELFVTQESAQPALHTEYSNRVVEVSTDTESAFSADHLHRGPPRA